jgi:tetratricopeptide (TPR) repeat protein
MISGNIIKNVQYHGIISDWSSPSIKDNTISKDASHYYHANCGIWTYGSSPYITGNTIQGFGYGLYPTESSSPRFWTNSYTTPYPNNRVKDNLYGLVTYNSCYVHMGEWNYYTDEYYGNNNGLDNNQYDDIYVFNSSAVYAQNNWWGNDHVPSYWVQSGSSFDWYNPLWQCPWGQNFIAVQKGGEPATMSMSPHNSPPIAQGQSVLPRQHDFRDDLMKAFMLRKLERYGDAMELYKKLLAGEKSFKPALIELTDMFRETKDDAILQFFRDIQSDIKTYPLAVQNRPMIFELLASMYIQQGEYSTAKQIYDNVITQFSGTSDERHSRLQKFYLALHFDKDKDAATQLLNDITSRYADGEDVEFAKYIFSQANFSSPAKSNSLGTNLSLSSSKTSDVTIRPEKFELSANYPNPFNPSTTIRFAIPEANVVTLKVYDVLGKEVVTLVNEEKSIGFYEVQIDATRLSSGIYFYQMQAGSFHDVKKMLLLK